MAFMRNETTFASTVGSVIVQTVYRTYPQLTVTAVASDFSDFQSRTSAEVAPMGMGYEHVEDSDLVGRAAEWAEEAVQKMSAKPVTPGLYDLILDPSHLFLTIHESIGHPTELDRALGYEANYAGTSFIAPPERMIGALRYGPEIMNVQGDRTQLGALATVAWDDEGVPADSWHIIKDGVFVDYQTTREQAAWIAELTGITRSHGCAFASSWDRTQFQRMPNVSLLPGTDDNDIDDLIAATDRGIVIYGRGSYSIDQQRYNFQFGGQVFYEPRWKDRGHAAGRRVPGAHDRLLEFPRHAGRPPVLPPRGYLFRREGATVAVQRGESRLSPDALPWRHCHQHRRGRVNGNRRRG
jgi:TldD protein